MAKSSEMCHKGGISKYWCYYLQTLRESVSPVRGILSSNWPTGPIWSSSRDVCPRLCDFVTLSPSHAIFLGPWTGAERHSSEDWCGASLALAWSPKNGDVFRNGRVTQ